MSCFDNIIGVSMVWVDVERAALLLKIEYLRACRAWPAAMTAHNTRHPRRRAVGTQHQNLAFVDKVF